ITRTEISADVIDILEIGDNQIAIKSDEVALVTTRGLRSADIGQMARGELKIFDLDLDAHRRELSRQLVVPASAASRALPGVPPKDAFHDLDKMDPKVSTFLGTLDRVITDEIANDEHQGKRVRYFGRDHETLKALEVLSRIKGPNPVLTGD